MWQCQTNWPGLSNFALMRVTSPGYAMTVSLNPDSHSSGPLGVEPGSTWTVAAVSSMMMPLAVDHLEQHLVHVHRVGVAGGVVELPELGGAHRRVLRDRLGPRCDSSTRRGRCSDHRRRCRALPRPESQRTTSTSPRPVQDHGASYAPAAGRLRADAGSAAGSTGRGHGEPSRGTGRPGRWCRGRRRGTQRHLRRARLVRRSPARSSRRPQR